MDSKSFADGAIAGAVGVAVSHPFDTIKTHIQKGLLLPQNLKGYYRGIVPPLIGTGFEKLIVFGVFSNINKLLSVKTNIGDNSRNFLSGLTAGFAASSIVTPVDQIKILLQTNQKVRWTVKDLYKGYSMTLARETPGFGIYFTVYEYLKRKLYIEKNKQITPIGSFCIGGFTGAVAWTFIYPMDNVKTNVQADVKSGKSLSTAIANVRKVGVYNGFSLALLRCVPLHAGVFCTMEQLKRI